MGTVAPIQGQERNTLRCTGCGATTAAPCGCGVPFELLKPSEAAKIGIKETPQLSDRAIAQRLDIGKDTVRLVRPQVAQNTPPADRIGLDGKTYPMPAPRLVPPPTEKYKVGDFFPGCGMDPNNLPFTWTRIDISSEHAMGVNQVLDTIKKMTTLQRRLVFIELKERYADELSKA